METSVARPLLKFAGAAVAFLVLSVVIYLGAAFGVYVLAWIVQLIEKIF